MKELPLFQPRARDTYSSVQTLWHLREEANGQTTLRAASWRSLPSILVLTVWLVSLSGLVRWALYLGPAMNLPRIGNGVAIAFVVLGASSIAVFVVHQHRSARIGTVLVIDSMRNAMQIGDVRVSFSKVRAIVLAQVFYCRGSDIIEYPEIHVVDIENGTLRRSTVVDAGKNCKKVAGRLAEVLRVPLVKEEYRVGL